MKVNTTMSNNVNMTTTLLVQAKGDHRLATALHEAGHAVAYLALGKAFSHMEIDGVSDHVGELAVVPGSMIDPLDKANTAMTGPVSEAFMYRGTIEPSPATVDLIRSSHAEHWDYVDSEPDHEGGHDFDHVGEYFGVSLPWALTLVTRNWSVIERIATAALHSPNALSYDQIADIAGAMPVLDLAVWQSWETAIKGYPVSG